MNKTEQMNCPSGNSKLLQLTYSTIGRKIEAMLHAQALFRKPREN
jgi:hypothetical protein